MIAALLLAAGASRRFGAAKLLQDLRGKPVIRWSAEALAGWADDLIVVVPPEHDAVRGALAGLNLRFVVNEHSEQGIGSSIARGIASVAEEAHAVVIALADEPFADPDIAGRVLAAWRAESPEIVQPRFRGVPGHPALFARSVFADLRALTGDHGARAVIQRDPSRVLVVDIDAAQPVDIDTPMDLERLRAQYIPSTPATKRS